jgi:acyl-CoA thioester hydrolase
MTTLRIPIRWRDLDDLGHVNQAVYHEYLEEGRGALFAPLIEAVGSFQFVLARIELDYRHEVRHTDREIDVTTTVEKIGRTSVTVANSIHRTDGTLIAEGRAVLVAWEGAARRSRALTDWEKQQLGHKP